MKQEYLHKKEFVKDFVALCRKLRYESPTFTNEYVCICGELWAFSIHAGDCMVSTEAALAHNGQWLIYPRTIWGRTYARWDTELREFLNREVCKLDTKV